MSEMMPPETIGELARRTSSKLDDLMRRLDELVPSGTRVLREPGEIATMARETHEQVNLFLRLQDRHQREYEELRKNVDDQREIITEVRGAFALVSKIGVLLIVLILGSMAFGAYIVSKGGHLG
jgi:hypothetical protein